MNTSRSSIRRHKKRFVALFVLLAHVAGALASVQAVMESRTAQGAIAWAVSLNTVPYVAVPAYLAFGRDRFEGYVKKRREKLEETNSYIRQFILEARAKGFLVEEPPERTALLERLVKIPATIGNDLELLINGDMFFPSLFEGLNNAEEYLLAQFYIVRDDALGREFQHHLMEAAARGVRVYFLYDEIGCYLLPGSYLETLREAGVVVHAFNSTLGRVNRFQINFRNHRKVVVADGRVAWVGSANVGDEYMHKHPRLTPWRDLMLKVTGPAVQSIQIPFLEDWFWASGDLLELEWTPQAARSGASHTVLCLPTGPADRFETCALYFLNAIHSARHRLWIASPYFVPDEQIVSALQLAALRGVDVCILVPDDCDHLLVRLSGWSYVAPLEAAGVKVYRHTNGFLHHKAMLMDDHVSAIGTPNFDNRSFRLNFEILMEIRDVHMAKEIEQMFLEDFADARLSSASELEARRFPVRFAVRVARLLSPLQ